MDSVRILRKGMNYPLLMARMIEKCAVFGMPLIINCERIFDLMLI